MTGKLVGNRVKRLEDPALLRGKGRFVDDIQLPDMLHAAFVRSPHAHAAIKGIDASAAKALPGVQAVLTLDDLLPHLRTKWLVVGLPSPSYKQDLNRPALAGDEVVHVGEPVAVIIADSRHVAEDAIALVDIDYEPLAPVVDARAALAEGAPTAHRNSPHNVLAAFDMGYGEVEAAFRSAPHVFKESLWQHRGGSHSIECRGCVAAFDPIDDRLTVWSSTQTPHTAARILGDMLGRDQQRLRLVTPDVGGGFGPKLVFYPEDVVVSLAALLLARPVKWIEDRREHFVASTQERDQYWEVEIAVDGEGNILGIRGDLIHEHGAYTARGVNLPYESAITLTLPYEVPAFHMDVTVALTNKVPVTPVRGAGHPQAAFVMERLLDRVAGELGLDRAEVRFRNLVPGEKMPYQKPLKNRGGTPVVLDSGDYPAAQRIAMDRVGWADFAARQEAARREGRYIGLGLGNYVKGTGRGPFESVTVRVDPTGKVHVLSGAAPMGQSTKTMLAQIVADQLGGDMANLSITAGDTGAVSMGIGGFNSRQAVVAGTSAHVAATKVREKVIKVASHMLEAAEEDLEIAGGEVRVKGSDRVVGLGQIATAVAGLPGFSLPGGIEPGMEASETVVIDEMTFSSGTTAVEVEVDIETGGVTILNYVLVHDCGTIINPTVVDGQVIGGAAHGIGNALYEWMGYDEYGQPVTTNLGEYLLVSAPEVPTIDVVHVETPTPLNPLGVKGVGECGTIPATAAIISAIEHALSPFGARLARSPVTPAEIVAAATPVSATSA